MITHTKVSLIPDSADISQILPSDWNAAHEITQDTLIWESSGEFTILAGSTSKVVSHGLLGTPKVVCSVDAFVIYRVINRNATQFTFEIEAPQESNLVVNWLAIL